MVKIYKERNYNLLYDGGRSRPSLRQHERHDSYGRAWVQVRGCTRRLCLPTLLTTLLFRDCCSLRTYKQYLAPHNPRTAPAAAQTMPERRGPYSDAGGTPLVVVQESTYSAALPKISKESSRDPSYLFLPVDLTFFQCGNVETKRSRTAVSRDLQQHSSTAVQQ